MSLGASDQAVKALCFTLLCLFIFGRRLIASRFMAPARNLRSKALTKTKPRQTYRVY